MRRMISDVMQRQIKNLFETVQTDANGNVEIGKNLTVDGNIKLNSPDNLTFKSGGLPKYYHFITLVAGPHPALGYKFTTSFLMPATSNLKITKLEDLFTVFSGDYVACSGTVTYGGGTGNLLGIHFADNANDTKVIIDGGENGIVQLSFHGTYGVAQIGDYPFQPK